MSKINLSETHINSYKTKDDIKFKKVYDEWDRINSNANRRIFLINDDNYEKFKLKQVELKLKKQLEDINDIKHYGYIGFVGLAGRF
jgi:uncharacterized protein YycO